MKEATGELSTTMIAVVAIAAVLTIFTTVLLPVLKKSIQTRMHCAEAICQDCGTNSTCNCVYTKDDGSGTENITCPNPNKN